jgi:hypothetical protein
MASVGTAGYTGGGSSGGQVIDKLAFSNDSRTTIAGTLSASRYYLCGYANSANL